MSHEIRTPMNGVLGAANLLATTGLTPEQRQYVDILTTSGRALLGIINDVLRIDCQRKCRASAGTIEDWTGRPRGRRQRNQRAYLTRMLAILGYRTKSARSGAEALTAVGATEFAAILMDCQMLVMDGFTTTHKLRDSEADGSRIPIIAITATATTEDQSRCFASGMDDYLPKPIIMERLAEALERWAPIIGS